MITTQYRQISISILVGLMTLLGACAPLDKKPEQTDTSHVLNQAAKQYVKLGLELGEYDKDLALLSLKKK